MPIHFICPWGHKLIVPDHRAGKKGRCPNCQQQIIVPTSISIPLGPQHSPLNAGPGRPVQLDPQPQMPIGFDLTTTFEKLTGTLIDVTAYQSVEADESAPAPGDATASAAGTASPDEDEPVVFDAIDADAQERPARAMEDFDDELLDDIPDEPPR